MIIQSFCVRGAEQEELTVRLVDTIVDVARSVAIAEAARAGNDRIVAPTRWRFASPSEAA